MYRRDYILKMIEEFARAIAVSIGLKDSGRDSEALEELRKAYSTWYGLNSGDFLSMSEKEFLELLVNEKKLSVSQLEILAKALMTEGNILGVHPLSLEKDRFRKALCLYEFADKTDTATFSAERKQTILLLKEKVYNEKP